MKTSLELKLSQSLSLTPELRQAIALLQLGITELSLEIQRTLEENPLLEWEEAPSLESAEPTTSTEPDTFSLDTGEPAPRSDNWELEVPETRTLQDYLRWQMDLTPFSPTDLRIADAIIDAIDADGYLSAPLEEIRTTCDVPTAEDALTDEEVQAVLHRVQQFDPVGVAATSLAECLSRQVLTYEQNPETQKRLLRLIQDHLPDVGKRAIPKIAKALKVPVEQVESDVETLCALNPKPGATFGSERVDAVIPDAMVEKRQGEWHVLINESYLPKLRLSQAYEAPQQDISATDKAYLQKKWREARWFLKSLETRQTSLLNVVEAIVSRQNAFLESGETAMRPLVLQEIADTVDLHASSVSRITMNKFLATPQGVFPLKYFFSAALPSSSGHSVSSTAIKAELRQLIDTEDKTRPLSDAALSQALHRQGMEVARRTVAKYREQLSILPAFERKQR